jgi:hypothetical protein
LVYNHNLGCNRNWQTAFVWGRNRITGGGTFDSYLMESSLKQDDRWSPYLRLEQVEKSGEELVLPAPFAPDASFRIRQATLGLTVDLGEEEGWQWGLGGAYIFGKSPAALDPVYGTNPNGWMVYLRGHPRKMDIAEMDMEGMDMSSMDMDSHAENAEQAEQTETPPAKVTPPADHSGHQH